MAPKSIQNHQKTPFRTVARTVKIQPELHQSSTKLAVQTFASARQRSPAHLESRLSCRSQEHPPHAGFLCVGRRGVCRPLRVTIDQEQLPSGTIGLLRRPLALYNRLGTKPSGTPGQTLSENQTARYSPSPATAASAFVTSSKYPTRFPVGSLTKTSRRPVIHERLAPGGHGRF